MNIPYSEQAMMLACRLSLIEESLESANRPHTFCQLLKNFMETVRSEDPNKFHYDIARETLQQLDKEALKNEQAVDMLAREFMKACLAFDEKFSLPANFAKRIRRNHLASYDPYLSIVNLSNTLVAVDEQFFTKDGLTIWDSEYLALLESTGAVGKKQSTELSKKLSSADAKWNNRFWFREQSLEGDVHFFQTPAFLGLAAVLWEDVVERRARLTSKSVPSPSANVQLPMQKALSPKTCITAGLLQ